MRGNALCCEPDANGYCHWHRSRSPLRPGAFELAPRSWPGHSPGATVTQKTSRLGAVVEVNHAVAESTHIQQLQLHANVVGQELLPASDHDGSHEQVALVDQPGPERLGCQVGAG